MQGQANKGAELGGFEADVSAMNLKGSETSKGNEGWLCVLCTL